MQFRSILSLIANTHQAFQDPSRYEELTSYHETSLNNMWVEAMTKELQALETNKTCNIVDLPKGKKAIATKWVYKTMYKPDGTLERFKARIFTK